MITYIEKLLNGQPVEWKTLGEVGTFVRGSGLPKKTLQSLASAVFTMGRFIRNMVCVQIEP